MWIQDLTKALWMLNIDPRTRATKLIERIEGNIIYTTDHTFYKVEDLVAQYDEEYGES